MDNQAYLLLDGARLKSQIQNAIVFNPNHASLYKERSEENLSNLGPYLFTIPEKDDMFLGWYKNNGWGDSWGMIINSNASFEVMFNHFRKFLMVKTEEGEQLYFRFYDPRVLKIFLPTCDKDQLIEFFGPIQKFFVEGEDKETAIVFTLQNGALQQSEVSMASVFGLTPAAITKEAAAVETRKKRNVIIDDDLRDVKK